MQILQSFEPAHSIRAFQLQIEICQKNRLVADVTSTAPHPSKSFHAPASKDVQDSNCVESSKSSSISHLQHSCSFQMFVCCSIDIIREAGHPNLFQV
jgi:hypothetical protein